MKKPELLAPAGNKQSLIAAIEAGCDAVYLAGKLYGARSYAGNFSNEELIEALDYAHEYGVKIYVTINTLVYEAEVDNFIEYVKFLYEIGVDAVIIQDIGMFDLIHQLFPNLEIHISTQMHIHNLEGVKLAAELGASRVVLARETPIDLVKNIKDNTNLEIEIFIHGALCISYSGQCLMSSLIGGRSGNRGTCAQCCRMPYDLYCDNQKINTDNYLLSTKDLNTLDNIGTLIDMGIDSLKIEGRMKRPEYVYFVVSLYRKAIDNYVNNKTTGITSKDIYELKELFNRKFTKGFIFGEENNNFVNSFRPNHQGVEIGKVVKINNNNISIKLTDSLNSQDGIRILGNSDIGTTIQVMYKDGKKINNANKGDVVTIRMKELPSIGSVVLKTTDEEQIKRINQSIGAKERKVNIDMKLTAKLNNYLTLYVTDGNNHRELQAPYKVEKSEKVPMTKENIIKQINKTGDTIYNINNLELILDDNIFIPVKVLNDLRRNILEELSNIRKRKKKIVYGEYHREVKDYPKMRTKSLFTRGKVESGYDNIIVRHTDNQDDYLKLPRVLEHIPDVENNKLMVGELGSIYKYRNRDLISDFSLNVTNSYSVALLHSLGVNLVTLSIEMNDSQIKRLMEEYEKRYHAHPNISMIVDLVPEAMIMKYDPLKGTYKETSKYYLTDQFKNKYPIIREDNLTYIYNYASILKGDINNYYEMGINDLRKNSIF